MRPMLWLFTWACSVLPLSAQTAYYTNLINQLSAGYQLNGGSWSIAADEQQVLGNAIVYGSTLSVATVSNQPFSKAATLTIAAPGADPWSAGFFVSNTQAIAAGDRLLLVVWVRSATATNGRANLFVEHADTYAKEIYLGLDATPAWKQYLVPFEADQAYAAGKLHIGMHTGLQVQTLQVGGLALRNYAKAYALSQLPTELHLDYAGSAPDAPWRAPAAARIEQLRKADLRVSVTGPGGTPLSGATVEVEMLQHAFKFGSAITGVRIAGNHNQNNQYEQKILDFDGKGHGFNEVVFENDLKWDAWEEQWSASPAEIVKALDWLQARRISVRGHNLVWPGWSYLPNDLQPNALNLAYLKSRIDERIETMLTYPGLAGRIAEWDALNEITANQDLANAFKGSPGYPTGRELYRDILHKIKTVDPDMPAYLNDYVTIDLGNAPGSPVYEQCRQYVQEIYDAKAPVEGIGFQGHINGGLASMYTIEQTLDDFYNRFGYRAKITEFDLSELISDSLGVRFSSDFLTLAFSHPSVDGFLSWGFWDGAHWHDNAPFFDQNWNLKPVGQAFADLLFDQWWTRETRSTDANGKAEIRGFKGLYRVSVLCNGATVAVDTLQLDQNLQLNYTCGLTDVPAPLPASWDISFPNPAPAGAQLELRCSSAPQRVSLCTAGGRRLSSSSPETAAFSIALPDVSGLYWLEIRLPDGRIRTEKLVLTE
ncbi:MAG: endo-1,4-beta-xylanase [Saprospiraceae bacterium]|nr:endo-1,4-beta-xylanase [Saprospiraceae bacterium]